MQFTFLMFIRIVICAVTMGFGALSIISPQIAERFTGLNTEDPRGISEIRAVLGGLFFGLGLAGLIFHTGHAFGTVGVGYLMIAAVRGGSIFFDKAATTSNWISLATEVVFGILLLI